MGRTSSRKSKKKTGSKKKPNRFLHGRKARYYSILLAVFSPIVFLLLLELVLGMAGFGYPSTFFVDSEKPDFLTTNEHFGWFYQHETQTTPDQCLIKKVKPKDMIRIFVLGESAAMGTPDPSFGFARILEFMLERCFPQKQVEVTNAAMRGINSHVITTIASECAALEPDLFVIYMGNNEVIGLYGPGTSTGFIGRHSYLIGPLHRLKRTRIAQLLRIVTRGRPGNVKTKKKPPTMEYFRNHRLGAGDPRTESVYDNCRNNLKHICDTALQSGAGVVISTIAVNLRNCPPLGSLHRSGLTTKDKVQWDVLYKKASDAEERSKPNEALSLYAQAAEIDNSYAELQFRMARCHLATGNTQFARDHFSLARDLDALQFRTDSRLNTVVREVARNCQNERVALADAETAFDASDLCLQGVAGSEFFYEHVHLRFEGDYELARTCLPKTARLMEKKLGLTASDPIDPPSIEQCAERLAFTHWDRVNMEAGMLKLTAGPPFTDQLDHAKRQAQAEKAVADVMKTVDQAFVAEVIETYEKAINAHPEDWRVHYNLGTFLHQLKRFDPAARHLQHAVQAMPHVNPFRILLGYSLSQAGHFDQAADQFREVLKRDKHNTLAKDALQQITAARIQPH